MDRTKSFRQVLASRLIQIAGVAALTAPSAASGCGGNVVVDPAGDGGSGGVPSTSVSSTSGTTSGTTTTTTSTTTTSVSSTGTGPQPVYDCFPWNVDAPCPAASEAQPYFDQTNCTDPDYMYTYQVVDGPYPENGQCCYYVYQDFCGVGRPFLSSGGRPLAAAARAGGPGAGWAAGGIAPRMDGLTFADREALAAAWARDGLLEHASVASFARFSLDLLAAGAPADLVEAAHMAALDEVRHARLCLALASAYRGAPVEPGPFPCGDAVRVESSLPALATAAVKEGCVGETMAAILAAEQLSRATDPAVREVLATIARDEARHAELAFRAVAWAIRVGGDPVRAAVAAAFEEAARSGAPAGITDTPGGGALAAHGRLDAMDASAAAARALAEVVLPSGRALLAASRSFKDSCIADQV